jgi:surface polysaccharide O-acyltransferase-like enzyme
MMAPLVGVALWVDALPQWIQWYVRPAGEHTTFTAFPWIGFVFAGAAVGALLVVAQDDRTERRIHVAVALAGAALVAAGLSLTSRQTIHDASAFWTSSPAWFSIRTGVLMIALPAVFWVGLVRGSGPCRWQQRLAKLGRHSLFVYWIHVELVYGYASWLWRGRLPLWGTAVAALLFAALMYGAIVVRDWAVESGHMRQPCLSNPRTPRRHRASTSSPPPLCRLL